MSLIAGFSQLLEQCGNAFLQYLETLDIDTMIEGIQLTKKSHYAIIKIQHVMQNQLADVMNAESIAKRFEIIKQDPGNKDKCAAYFNYFQGIDSSNICIHKYEKNEEKQTRLIEFILKTQYMLQDKTNEKPKKAISNVYKISKYCHKELLNIESNQVMCFNHKELIDWDGQYMLHQKERYLQCQEWGRYDDNELDKEDDSDTDSDSDSDKEDEDSDSDTDKEDDNESDKADDSDTDKEDEDSDSDIDEDHSTLDLNEKIVLCEDGCPKFYDYTVEFGYLSADIEKCVLFLLEKGKGVRYGNDKRVEAASFMVSKLFLSNIYQCGDFIAVFDRLDQIGWYPQYPCRTFKMKFFWICKKEIDESLALLVSISV